MEEARRELGFAEMILRKGRPKKKKAPVLKKSEVEQKLLFEITMREAAQRLLSACSNPQQRLDAAKTILTSNSRTLALMTALQREHVKEVEDAHGLTDLKDKDEIMREEMMDSVSLADISLSNIMIPLKWCKIEPAKYKAECWKYQLFCLVRCGAQVMDSGALVRVDLTTETVVIDHTFTLKDVGADFVIDLEFYYTQTEDSSKQKKKKSEQVEPVPVFAIAGTATLTLAHCNIWQQKQSLKGSSSGLPAHITAPTSLPDLPPLPIMNFYRVHIEVKPHFTLTPAKEGFLDVQHMLGGMPHWARSWCSLHGMYLRVWRRPEDQGTQEPGLIITVNEHMLLDHVPKSSVQRPHTIHISYNKSPYIDHYVSTDTKEDRILWEIALHKAVLNSSAWHPNKLSNAENEGTYPSPLKSAPPKPPRPVPGGTPSQFCYTPSAPNLPSYRAQFEQGRSARKDKLFSSMKRSKSAERSKKTPAPPTPSATAENRSRAKTCSKPAKSNRRRSRSVDLTPQRRVEQQRETNPRSHLDFDTPRSKDSRVSDATYVSMHKFSRVPVSSVQWQGEEVCKRPARPAPRPPSLSKIPSAPPAELAVSSQKTPRRPLSKVNESYRTAVTKETPSPAAPAHSPAQMGSREKKRKAPTPQKPAPTPSQSSRQKKSPAPTPQRRPRVPRQSQGGTNNLNSPNRSDLRDKEGIRNLYEEEPESPASKVPNVSTGSSRGTPSSSRGTPSSFVTDFEKMIDEAFGSLQNETDGLSADTTPSFRAGAGRRESPVKSAGKTPNRRVCRNTPLTSTMKEGATPFTHPIGANLTAIGPTFPQYDLTKENFAPIAEEEEENEGGPSSEGCFTSSHSTIGEEGTPQPSPIPSPVKGQWKRRSESPGERSPYKKQKSPYKKQESPYKEHSSPYNQGAREQLSPTRESKSPLKEVRSQARTPYSREALFHRQVKPAPLGSPFQRDHASPAKLAPKPEPAAEAPAESRPKPKFRVVNGKLVPL